MSKQILIAQEEATCSNIGRQKTHIEKRREGGGGLMKLMKMTNKYDLVIINKKRRSYMN